MFVDKPVKNVRVFADGFVDEINYSGSQDEIRLQCLRQAQSSGNMDKMMAMVDRCLSEYDQNGWTVPHLHNNDDINMLDKLLK